MVCEYVYKSFISGHSILLFNQGYIEYKVILNYVKSLSYIPRVYVHDR